MPVDDRGPTSDGAPAAAVTLDIGGIRIDVAAHDEGLRARLRGRFAGWTPADAAPADAAPANAAPADAVIELRERGRGWQCARPYDPGAYPRAEVRHVDGSYQMWRTEFEGTVSGGRSLHATFDVDGSGLAGFETPVRLVTALVAAQRGALLIHSSGAVFDAGAVLFLAPSGGGKTTLLTLLPDRPHLSDDICVVSTRGARLQAGSSPFSGAAQPVRSLTANLAGICFLEQGGSHALAPCGQREAFRRILACTLAWPDDVATMEAVLTTVAALCARVPTFRLTFARTPDLEPFLASRFSDDKGPSATARSGPPSPSVA